MQNNYLLADYEAIGLTAHVLGTSEIRVFELAYQEWYGNPGRQCEIEHAFLAYLCEGRVACWVRAFIRRTMDLCDEAGVAFTSSPSGRNVTRVVMLVDKAFKLVGLGVLFLLRRVGGR